MLSLHVAVVVLAGGGGLGLKVDSGLIYDEVITMNE